MHNLLVIVVASVLVSLCSLVGVLLLGIKQKRREKMIFSLVGLSAGAMLGGAFLHLLPEALEDNHALTPFLILLGSFLVFFFLEKYLYWRHCHDEHCGAHALGVMSLAGDVIHNFIDGLVIAAAFLTDFNLGVVTALVIALHEIPQEVGDMAVLLHSGMSFQRALFWNSVVALSAVAGAVVGFFISGVFADVEKYLLPLAAGSFIYIGAADLIPEIRRHYRNNRSFRGAVFFIIGLLLMYLFTFLGAH